jgi:hypothetical protein
MGMALPFPCFWEDFFLFFALEAGASELVLASTLAF